MSFDFLTPAVSIKLSFTPPNIILPSTMSLVVPLTSVTIAFSSSKRALSKLDLPTFGLPRIMVLIPSFNVLPSSDNLSISNNFSFIILTSFLILLIVTTSISSYSG